MPLCPNCHKSHVGLECPQINTNISHLFQHQDEDDVDPEKEAEPLRKVTINSLTGREDNFIPSYYDEPQSVAAMGRDAAEYLRQQYEIEVEGSRCPNPITSFREAGLAPDIVNHLDRLGFAEPTPIQMQSLPCLLSGRDVVGMAETGSGKTLCYIIPMLMFLRTKPPTNPGEGPLVVILAPTRELVEQIYSETLKLMPQVGMSVNATSSNPSYGNSAPSTPAPFLKAPTVSPAAVAAAAAASAQSAASATSSAMSDLKAKLQAQKQQLQIKQQQAQQQQQIQQLQQQQAVEIQQLQESIQDPVALATQVTQLSVQHQAALYQLQLEHAQQQQTLLNEHAQQNYQQQQAKQQQQLKQQQQQIQQLQQQKEAQQQQDYAMYSQAANGQFDYSQYNYETASSYYNSSQADHSYPDYSNYNAEYTAYAQPAADYAAVTAAHLPPALPRKVLGVCGGVPISVQITPLQRGIDILVSTPGRLIDLMNKGVCKLDRVSYMVFDEADRMLALSMEVQLRHIVTHASTCVRQSVLFSATFPPAVERLVRSAVMNPIYIRVGGGNSAAQTISQQIVFVHSVQKRHKLLEILRSTEKPPVLIFANSHHTVDFLVKLLREEQFHVAGLHGEKNQPYRFRVMKAFKDGQLDILVATDVAARGIDVNDITHVIQFDLPENMEDYIHRIGRTGRAGKMGQSTAFLGLDCKIADELKQYLKQSKQPIPAELQNTKQFGGEIVRGELRDYTVKRGRV